MKVGYTLKSIFLVFFIILGAYLFIHYDLYFLLMHPEKAIQFINSFHPYDDFVFVSLQIFQVIIAGSIPCEITGFIGGYIYGPVLGSIYSTIGLGIGSWLAFSLARTFGLPLVKRVVRASIMEKYDCFIKQKGSLICFTLFLIPGFPKAALCYVMGLSQMNIWAFIVVATAGRLFGTILLSVSGSSVRNNHGAVFLALLVIIGILFLPAYFYRGRLMKMAESINIRKKKTF
jgi:uncharacterized membrane protein YdjX (TVP38/TMEM64 family)